MRRSWQHLLFIRLHSSRKIIMSENSNSATPITVLEHPVQPVPTTEVPRLTPDQQTSFTQLLQRIRHSAVIAGYLDTYAPIVIRHGNQRLFEAVTGEAPRVDRMEPEHLALLQAALERPESIRGTVKILIGDREVYRIQAGEVKTDLLGLAAQEQSTSPNPHAAEATKATNNTENKAKAGSAAQIPSTLLPNSQTNGHLSRSLATSEQSQPTSRNGSNHHTQEVSQPATSISHSASQTDLERLRSQIEQLENRIQQLNRQLQSVQSTPARWVATTEQNLQSWTQAVKRAIAEPMVRSMEGGLRQAVKLFGEVQADGSISYDSKRDQRYVIDGNHIAVSGRETGQDSTPTQTAAVTQTPADLWNQYTQGLQGSPSQIAMQAARQALSDHIPAKDVMQMLRSDPQCQRTEVQQGSQAAQRYAELVVSRASYQVLQPLQTKKNLQTVRQVQSFRQL
ncbi:hypothetical protein NIES2135_67260 (plasmid) [Leptolyngbya boryana NIES-2135]|jgi:hypothetical protein|uniref:Uncharacterized protein n=2 Tax=Leptolyngbya group TaxID=3081713 RepID=A0A1Z4JSX9_LEPBY|nr:hypothetical protein NIES2135_67260 [Leptolyngbya boryana NIES-2135]